MCKIFHVNLINLYYLCYFIRLRFKFFFNLKICKNGKKKFQYPGFIFDFYIFSQNSHITQHASTYLYLYFNNPLERAIHISFLIYQQHFIKKIFKKSLILHYIIPIQLRNNIFKTTLLCCKNNTYIGEQTYYIFILL